jgi:hypothetical protein
MIAPVVTAALAIAAGPALTGPHVTWSSFALSVYSSNRRVWTAPHVEAPLFQRVGQIVASGRRVAFIRTVEFQRWCAPDDICPYRREVVQKDLWSGPPQGPFKRVHHGLTLDVDVDGTRVLYSDTFRVVLGRGTVASSGTAEYPEVALAGRYAAWTEVPRGRNSLYEKRALVVYDLRAHRVAYRLEPASFVDVDLAADGTVAFGQDPTPVGGPDGGVGWASLAEPWPHFLNGNAIPFEVRLASGRVAFFTRGALVVRELDGKVVKQQRAAYGDFDFDGHRLAYLRSPKSIGIARIR